MTRFTPLFAVVTALALSIPAVAQKNTPEIWEALNKNDHPLAERLIGEKAFSPENYITGIYLKSYKGKEKTVTSFDTEFYGKADNPYPYIYALWFNEAVLGEYGKKLPHQERLMNKLLNDPNTPGTLKAATHYQMGMHLLYSGDLEKSVKAYGRVGNIRNWQYVGPFENLSQSGFNKDHGPLANPGADAEFLSATNAKIRWFVPAVENAEGWTPLCFQVNKRTAVSYAQTFVESPEEQEVLLNAGATGAVKIWVNDRLLFSDYKERVTELDTYTVPCKLQKGVNRILVMLSYTDMSYPNFCIRLTDKAFNPVEGLQGSAVYKPYLKVAGNQPVPKPLPLFAETFFQEKIAKDSSEMVNYLLLSEVYLRNRKNKEARELIETALRKAPANNLLRLHLVQVLIKEENRTVMLEELEKIKKSDPECLLALELGINEDLENEKLEDAAGKLQKRTSLYGEDESTVSYRIKLLSIEKKFDELVKAGEDAYKKYPDMATLLPMAYAIKKEVYKDKKGANQVYENYLKKNFNPEVIGDYANILKEQGETKRSLALRDQLLKAFPYDPNGLYEMSGYYYKEKQYGEAEKFLRKALALSPYHQGYWEQLGDIKSELKQTEEAITAYEASLRFDPNQYEVINKIRKLKGKPESYKLFPNTDIDAIIRNDDPSKAKNTDYGYYIVHNEENVIVHPGGAAEEFHTFIVKITNEKGIDRYKESSIGYNSSQDLLIEKADIYKKSGSRLEGERSGNEVVFTNLEVGDVLVFKYRIRTYDYGRFSKEYWSKFHFNSQVYIATARFSILMPEERKLHYTFLNSKQTPVTAKIENFTSYTWEQKDAPTLKDEPLMPVNGDVGEVLHVSTLQDWKEIADWYADITSNKREEDYEVTQLFSQLLPDAKKAKLSQFNQARLLYDYIEKNIRYSSVSFRQGAYIPQSASLTLNTRLGDCKDLSNLFVTLCRMAGIEAQMVLVDTRENGGKDMVLPSLEFNHCIARARLDGKDYYIELTDNNLPFASLPNNILGALMLEIPSSGLPGSQQIGKIAGNNRTRDLVKRELVIKPSGNDLLVTVNTLKKGHNSSGMRASYHNVEYDKQLIEMEKSVANGYKNNVKVDTVSFTGLDHLSDSVTYSYRFRVKDEITEIGSMKAFRISYPDIVASVNNFSADTRTLPIVYADYEDLDEYETIVHIEAPAGLKFVELPANETLRFGDMQYSIEYKTVTPGKLQVTRRFTSRRDTNIQPADYIAFRSFFEKIVKAEQKLIAFK